MPELIEIIGGSEETATDAAQWRRTLLCGDTI